MEHGFVHQQLHGTCAKRSQLTQHDIFSNAPAIIRLPSGRGLEENLNGLFKGAAQQGTGISPVNAVSSNG